MRNTIAQLSLLFVASIGFFAACGGPATPADNGTAGSGSASASAAPSASAEASASASASTTPAAKSWDAMSHAERLELMKTVIVPKMAADFQGFDAKKYEKFGCGNCHGARIKDGNFAMPNPELPHLSFTDGFKKHMTAKPEITKFMMQKVEIDMAAALGLQPFDMKTKQGFGCSGCHIVGP
jgi:hypothetical protein